MKNYIQVYDEKKDKWVLKAVDKVPEPQREPEEEPRFFALDLTYNDYMWHDTMRELQAANRRDREREREQRVNGWANLLTTRIPARYYYGDVYTTVDDHATATAANNAPVERADNTPAPPVQMMYYPGAGVRAETVEPREDQHARRVREYREEIERIRRRRRGTNR